MSRSGAGVTPARGVGPLLRESSPAVMFFVGGGSVPDPRDATPGSMGPEGFEPPPTGLKGRHAAATPRPRVTYGLPGFSFDPGHDISPRYEFCSRKQPVWESNPPLR